MEINFSKELTLYVTEQDAGTLTDFGWKLEADNPADNVVRFVRGSRSRTFSDCLDEFSAALQFPYYFGQNWNAFHECIGDLSWLNCTFSLVIVLDANQLLAQEDAHDFEVLIRALQDARWERRIDLEEKGLPFEFPFAVLFQCPRGSKDEFADKLRAVDANYSEQ